MRKRSGFNPKRHVAEPDAWDNEALERLAAQATYTGHPAHKRHPGDFGLTPPSNPRPGATLCDEAGIMRKADAQSILMAGIRLGLVSDQKRGEWPQNIWAVTDDRRVFEAQLENPALGTYHGYPLPRDDDFRDRVLNEWELRR